MGQPINVGYVPQSLQTAKLFVQLSYSPRTKAPSNLLAHARSQQPPAYFYHHVRYHPTISLFLQCTMPRFSQFYSATEPEAAAAVRQLALQQSEGASPSGGNHAERLTNYLNGSPAFTLRSRNDVNQPIFRPRSTSQSVVKLLNEPRFNITEQRVIRDNRVVYASSSEGSVDWKARSRTPSSDEPSPPKKQPPSSTASPTTEASTIDDGLQHGRGYVWALLRDEIMGLRTVC